MTDYLDQPLHDYDRPDLVSAFDEVSLWAASFGALLLEYLPLDRARRVLDLACGAGFPLIELAGRLGPASQCVGLDVRFAALQRAALKRRVFDRDDVDLVLGNGGRMPFRDGSFDLITCNLGINNIPEPARCMKECARVLATGGRLLLTSNVQGHFARFYDVFREVVRSRGRPAALQRLHDNEAHRGTIESLTGLVEAAGLTVTRCVERPLEYRFANGSALLRHPLVRLGFLPGWRSVIEPAEEVGVFAEIEERLNTHATGTGELLMTVPMLLLEGTLS